MRKGGLALGLAAVALSAGAPAAHAQEQPSPNAVWTEPRALARAVARAPTVQAARAQAMASQALGAFGRVSGFGNPTVGVRAMVGWPNREASTYALFVGFPIDVSGQRALWRREASWAARQAEAQLRAASNDARATARQAYADVAIADESVRVTSARVETAREFLTRTQARMRAQAATGLDLSLSEHEVAQAEADLAGARRDREEAVGRFRVALDLPATATVAVAPLGAPTMPAGFTRESAIERALARRAEPRGYAAAGRRLRISTDRLRAQAIAPLTLAAEYELQYYEVSTIGASAQWSLPVLQTNQGERAVAEAEAGTADVQRGLAERDVARETAANWNVLALRLEELRALRDRAVPSLERTLALTTTLFENGAVDFFRVLLARQELSAARLRSLTVARDAWRARVALDRAMGEGTGGPL